MAKQAGKASEAVERLQMARRAICDISPQFRRGEPVKDALILADQDILSAMAILEEMAREDGQAL